MSQSRQILHNSIAVLGSNLGGKVLGFLIMLTVARFLGAERFGLYTLVFAFTGTFALLTDLGLTTVVIRRLTQNDDGGRLALGDALVFRWTVSAVMYAITVGAAAAAFGGDGKTALIAVSALSFLTIPLMTYSAVFNARMRLYEPAVIGLASKVVLLIVVQWLARSGADVLHLLLSEVALGAVASIVIWRRGRTHIQARIVPDLDRIRAMLSEGVPLFLTTLFVALYFRIDVFFIEHFRGSLEVGWYAAAFRLTEALPLVAAALANSVFPVFCKQVHDGDQDAARRLTQQSLNLLLVIVVPLAVGLAYYSSDITRLLYGPAFGPSAGIIAILSANQVLVFTNILLTTLLVARGEGRRWMRLTIVMLVFNVLSNLVFVPRFGAVGAAWTTVATELVGTFGCLLMTSTGMPFLRSVGRLALPALACLGSLALTVRPSGGSAFELIWPLPVMLSVYVALLMWTRVVDRTDLERLRRLVWG